MNSASQRDEVRSPATATSDTMSSVDRPQPSATHASPFLAVALSLVAPGAGHLHAWHPALAAAAWIVVAVVNATVIAVLVGPMPRAGVIIVLAGAVAVYVGVAVHCWRLARNKRAGTRPPALVRAACVMAFIVASWAFGMSAEGWVQRIVESYRVSSGSMEPALLPDEWILASRSAEVLRPGRLIVYRRSGMWYVKRVVGVTGDTLAMRERRLYRNAREVPEPYATYNHRRVSAAAVTWGPVAVPPGKVFVLGDNRNDALDSRYFGFIDADSVVGSPARIYFSRDPVTARVRWRRIGMIPR